MSISGQSIGQRMDVLLDEGGNKGGEVLREGEKEAGKLEGGGAKYTVGCKLPSS